MNEEPLRTPSDPAPYTSAAAYWGSTSPAGKVRARVVLTGGFPAGQYFKQSTWGKQGAERILVGCSRSYTLGCTDPIPASGDIPPPGVGVNNISAEANKFDRFRHGDRGKKPIGYTALYCDGHATTNNDEKTMLLGTRRCFPG
jgi:hypothetical protein